MVRIGRKLAVDCNKKLPSPPLTTLKGRERRGYFYSTLHPWCHPNCLSFSVEVPYSGDALTNYVVLRVKGRFSMVVMLRGNHPPVPTCLVQRKLVYLLPTKLSSASRSRMRSEMRFHSELPLYFGSLLVATLVLCSLDAGQSLDVHNILCT